MTLGYSGAHVKLSQGQKYCTESSILKRSSGIFFFLNMPMLFPVTLKKKLALASTLVGIHLTVTHLEVQGTNGKHDCKWVTVKSP